jgi:hypothetical protein
MCGRDESGSIRMKEKSDQGASGVEISRGFPFDTICAQHRHGRLPGLLVDDRFLQAVIYMAFVCKPGLLPQGCRNSAPKLVIQELGRHLSAFASLISLRSTLLLLQPSENSDFARVTENRLKFGSPDRIDNGPSRPCVRCADNSRKRFPVASRSIVRGSRCSP